MPKPRIFVSSTYYDLKHIRNSLESFITSMGFESVLFESGDIAFLHDQPFDESCYAEIHNCHMLVLIIGGRYGSPTSDSEKPKGKELTDRYERYNSITRKEYETAQQRDIPIFIFVEKNVLAEFYTYKKNRDSDSVKYVHVDSVNIYRLLDDILSQRRNNFVKDFERFDDIASWLRDQWAGIFAEALSRKSNETSLKDLAAQIDELSGVSTVLKEYTEAMMKKIQPDEFQQIITEQSERLRSNKLRRFAKEPLISFLLNSNRKVGSVALYSALENSNGLEDFLKRAKFEQEFIAELTNRVGKGVKYEYDYLMKQYVKEENSDFDQ